MILVKLRGFYTMTFAKSLCYLLRSLLTESPASRWIPVPTIYALIHLIQALAVSISVNQILCSHIL
jgi:hypothetical protein